MAIFVDPNRTLDYVLREQREEPAAKRVVFKLRGLTARESAEFRDASTVRGDDGARWTKVFSFDVELLRLALVGWSGPDVPAFPDPATPDAVEEALSRLSSAVVSELSLAAWGLTHLGEEGKDDSP